MMSSVLDVSSHGFILPFKQAVVAVGRATRRKWGRNAELPLLSHALSDNDGMRWVVRDISGRDVAVVGSDGRATLVDAVEGE